ncbi:sigma-70 family RNA polymerase sigma factor [Microvirga thermotolerans]|uniref:Sigma-70 family RNA polymerase sigma factor n=1 Tax=Microvirga thermotolerans TaxID=2651334 RepID=A0A5P9JY52_9HYPH|nr:sigma-70 family RNA polymerase sigma factor [Microvirga thermotolerans]QFU17363.1 sigma-70 family RNA polymerase sigma factor [Microvirga thermotolerans]
MDEIAALLEPLIPGLRRHAWALLRDDEAADDLVQDTLERAIGRWHSRRRDGGLKAWLYAIQHNLFLDRLRRQRRQGAQIGAEALMDVPSPDASPDEHARMRDILAALDALPEEQRSVMLLVSVEDLSYEEAAQALAIPVGTVMSRLSRAREKMRQYLETGRPAALRRVK